MAETVRAGDPVIDFALRGIDGRTYDLGEARRKGACVAFVFWKRTCGTCQYSFPYLQRLHEQYADGGFQIWGIAQENEEDTRAFAAQYGATFPQLLDTDLDVTERYAPVGVPTMYLVDESGSVQRFVPAFIADDYNAVARIAAGRKGAPYIPVVREEDNAPAIKPG